MGKEVGEWKGNGAGFSPEGEHTGWVLCLEFLCLLQAGNLGEVSGEGFSKIFISSPGVSFQRHGLH